MWNFNEYGNSVAAIDDKGSCLTYSELAKSSDEFKKVCGRTLAFNLCENSIGSLVGYACMLEAGIVPVMLDKNLDKELLKNLIITYNPDYFWIPEDMESALFEGEIVFSKYNYLLIKANKNESVVLFDELALLLTTSGSTGSPKLVRQSYKNIKANTVSIVDYLKLNDSERPITTLPMNYTYGLSVINSHLWVGATILLTEKTLMQKEFWSFFKKENATSFGGVPYTYEMLKKLRMFRMELPSLRCMTQAGGKLTPELHKEFAEYAQDKGIKFIVMYGQTEATARMAYLPAEMSLEKYGSMGIAIPGGSFSLIDVEGNVIEQSNIVGELVYEGDNVTLGYAESWKDLKKGDERFGKLSTGDMAQRDDDGYYYIVGRKKRFLKMFGKRINLDEIDRLLKTKFDNIECACAGKDDNMYIFVTDEDIVEDARQFVAEKTHLNLSGIKSLFVPEIPKNNSGKIMYIELQKWYS